MDRRGNDKIIEPGGDSEGEIEFVNNPPRLSEPPLSHWDKPMEGRSKFLYVI